MRLPVQLACGPFSVLRGLHLQSKITPGLQGYKGVRTKRRPESLPATGLRPLVNLINPEVSAGGPAAARGKASFPDLTFRMISIT